MNTLKKILKTWQKLRGNEFVVRKIGFGSLSLGNADNLVRKIDIIPRIIGVKFAHCRHFRFNE
jgi:hypothetical protein